MSDAIQENKRRVTRARVALMAYAEPAELGFDVSGQENKLEGIDRSELLTDLLADLMHYSEANGVDFKDSLRLAEMHYTEER